MTSKICLASISILIICLGLQHGKDLLFDLYSLFQSIFNCDTCWQISAQAHGHGHSHDEDPSFKWSKQANEQYQEDEILEEDIIDLPPQRGPPPKVNHGHSHGGHGHGHSHGGHGHGHSHGGHGHSHGQAYPEMTPEEREKARQKLHKNWDDDDEDEVSDNVWRNALGATFLISIFPFIILFIFDLFPYIRLDNSEEKKWIMNRILAFASGGLLGDAFLHLIPHASMASGDGHGHGHSHSHGHGHSHDGGEHEPHDLSVGLWVLVGIVAFLTVEKLVRIFNAGHSHGHGHSHAAPATDEKPKKDDKKKAKKDEKEDEDKEDDKEEEDKEEEKDEDEENEESEESNVNISGYLNLAADAFHNFTDGLAIGASFMAGQGPGFTTTLVILFHEIPHEIGDYAILVQSGVPPFRAKALQLVTALAAMLGCLVALVIQNASQAAATAFILPFTAGGFIYIATVSVIPGLLEGSSLRQSFWEIFSLGIGVYFMVIIAAYE